LVDTLPNKLRHRYFVGLNVCACGDRSDQRCKLGLGLALGALEGLIVGDALAGAWQPRWRLCCES
jgi:hypothetical protein